MVRDATAASMQTVTHFKTGANPLNIDDHFFLFHIFFLYIFLRSFLQQYVVKVKNYLIIEN